MIARIGGEEFAVLLTDVEHSQAIHLAESIRRQLIAEHRRTELSGTIQLTASLGVATVETPERDNPHKLFVTADQALYEAKRTGRNRVVG